MMDAICLDVLYENISSYIAISRDAYESLLDGWDVSTMEVGGNMVGVIMVRGHEMHICITRENAVRYGRRIIKKYLAAAMHKLGYVTTVSMKDKQCMKFLERLGFYITSETEEFINYRIDHLTLHRGALCHQ